MRHWIAQPRVSIFSCDRNIHRLIVQLVPLGDQDLALDDVDAGDHFGDRVLHLDARIDLNEKKFVAIQVQEELDGAGVAIVRPLAQPDRRLADAPAQLQRKIDARRDLDDLLMAALHRAIALPEMDDVAMLVAEDLYLDMLGAGDVSLDEDFAPAERRAGFALRLFELGDQIVGARTTRIPRPPPPKLALMMIG